MKSLLSGRLLADPLRVINIGLSGFARDLAANGAPVVHVEWKPSAKPELLSALSVLSNSTVEKANQAALEKILAAEPVLVGVERAGALIPELEREKLLLHAGPPIDWERMCGPLRGAVCGAIVFEGWAGDLAAAEKLAASGAVKFAPNHHFGAVGPMTGITSRSQPMMLVENRAFGNKARCTINEGLGKVMRFGGNDAEVLARLAWLRDEFGPLLAEALRLSSGIPLVPLIARGLSMGDEMHQRNVACTSLLLRTLSPFMARAGAANASLDKAFAFIAGNDQFFLNVAMAMGKSMMDPAIGVEGSTLVTTLSRNGTDFGVRVAGLGERWFTAPVEMPQGLFFPGYSAADANPDIGDSAILEAAGLGAFAMAAAPAVTGFVGAGGFADAVRYTREMQEIAAGRNPKWPIPALEFAGTPTGIDVRRVVETGIAPAINTGIAHRKAGVGQVGAGIARAPLACFEQALAALAKPGKRG
ncbi:MAG: oxamate carbamoyltransferase subunit AllG family protein [Betaproteobacteria bacterium]